MTPGDRRIRSLYAIVCALLLVTVVLRCAFVPFAHDEVATFFYYIQPGKFWPFYSHPDANGHFLINATSWVCYKLFGSSPLALRIPCVLGFVLLSYSVWRFRTLFVHRTAWLLLAGGLLVSFNFLAFYALCRGYGLSMSFFVLSLFYFFSYRSHQTPRHFVKSILFLQCALAANLILIPVILLCTFLLLLRAGRNLIRPLFIVTLAIHAALLWYWIMYGFYLKEQGALYYGEGESYWKTTFSSLISTVASAHWLVQVIALIGALYLVLRCAHIALNEGLRSLLRRDDCLSVAVFFVLIAGFYLMKKVGGVNYPEDRTALFFFIVYLISLAFMGDSGNRIQRLVLNVIPFYFACHFLANLNLRVHPWRIYETIPHSFVDRLIREQENSREKITIGGHRVREFFYGFQNYNTGGKLNHCTAPEALQMNCDYAIAVKADSIFYDRYYSSIESENDWGFRLIKRRMPIKRQIESSVQGRQQFTGDGEYFNAFELTDTSYQSGDPMLAEFEITVEIAPAPFNAWLVLQIDPVEGDSAVFIRTPLNLLKENWSGETNHKIGLLTGNVPKRIKRLVAYLWNIDKKPIRFTFNTFRLYRLEGEGVREISKATI
jgi:hypothetical protein